jgi:hypothetical protein
VLRLDQHDDDQKWIDCCREAAVKLVEALRAREHLLQVARDLERYLQNTQRPDSPPLHRNESPPDDPWTGEQSLIGMATTDQPPRTSDEAESFNQAEYDRMKRFESHCEYYRKEFIKWANGTLGCQYNDWAHWGDLLMGISHKVSKVLRGPTVDTAPPAAGPQSKERLDAGVQPPRTSDEAEIELRRVLATHSETIVREACRIFGNVRPDVEPESAERRLEVACPGGVWTVTLAGQRLQICDPSGRRVHSSNGHESTGVHLAMVLDELRRHAAEVEPEIAPPPLPSSRCEGHVVRSSVRPPFTVEINEADMETAKEIERLRSEIEELRRHIAEDDHAIEQALGKALGYPYIYEVEEDGKRSIVAPDYPGAVKTDEVCVGEHTSVWLAVEAADKLTAANAEIERLRGCEINLGTLRPKLADCEDALRKSNAEIERLKAALSVKPGGCRMLSEGDECDCTLCRQSKQCSEQLTAEREARETAAKAFAESQAEAQEQEHRAITWHGGGQTLSESTD